MRIIASLIFLSLTLAGFTQNPAQADLLKKMDTGVELMDQGKYEQADKQFLFVMQNMSTLPSNLAYYFGKNSYHLAKYKQSINWLNKYIQLKGARGRFYEDAVRYLQLSEDEYLKVEREKSDEMRSSLSSGEYDCGGLEKMICPVCKGEGVLIKQGPFENLYRTCPYSAGEPYLTCEEYNLFMKGELEPKIKD